MVVEWLLLPFAPVIVNVYDSAGRGVFDVNVVVPQPDRAATAPSEVKITTGTRNLRTDRVRTRRNGSSRTRTSAEVASGRPAHSRPPLASLMFAICIVSVEVLLPLAGANAAGEKLAAAPGGNPVAERATSAPKLPFVDATEIV